MPFILPAHPCSNGILYHVLLRSYRSHPLSETHPSAFNLTKSVRLFWQVWWKHWHWEMEMTSTSPIERRVLNNIIIQIVLLRISSDSKLKRTRFTSQILVLSINVILFIAIMITIFILRYYNEISSIGNSIWTIWNN